MSDEHEQISMLAELVQFIKPSNERIDLKVVALEHIRGLTGVKNDNSELLISTEGMAAALLSCMELRGKDNAVVSKDAALTLINMSGTAKVARTLLEMRELKVVARLWSCVQDPDFGAADACCMILSNLTIDAACCQLVVEALSEGKVTLEKIITVFCKKDHNTKGGKLHYLGPFLSNLSQIAAVRLQILDRNQYVIQRLFPFTEFAESAVRRGGVVGTLRNCCFNTEAHEWLLSDDVDILPRLLLPLAGPTPDDMDPEDVEMLPIDLQFLDEDKNVEADPDIRKMLLEAINQLCATKTCREIIRSKSAYFVLRELHKVEKDRSVRLACENLVDILIKKEEEINLDNYKEVEVPEDVVPELEAMDKDYLQEENTTGSSS